MIVLFTHDPYSQGSQAANKLLNTKIIRLSGDSPFGEHEVSVKVTKKK